MTKTITMRVDEEVYNAFRTYAERDNRPLSNFIETATMRFIREQEEVDPFEMGEIKANTQLNASLKRAHKDVKARRGSFA